MYFSIRFFIHLSDLIDVTHFIEPHIPTFFLDEKSSKKIKTVFCKSTVLNSILATQPKLVRQENLRLVPRQDFLSRPQTGLQRKSLAQKLN